MSLSQLHSQLAHLVDHATPSPSQGLTQSTARSDMVAHKLTQAKIALANADLLLPVFPPRDTVTLDDLATARSILELGALHSVRVSDFKAFESYLALLNAFYRDGRHDLPPSSSQSHLLALSLLRLLSDNKIASFHTELEALLSLGPRSLTPPSSSSHPTPSASARKPRTPSAPPAATLSLEDLERDPHIGYVIRLERWLMEGSYARAYDHLDQAKLPLPEFAKFVPKLKDTIRGEIASCTERAYGEMELGDVETLLFAGPKSQAFGGKGVGGDKVVIDVANSRGWNISPTTRVVGFPTLASASDEARFGLDKDDLIVNALSYARELEQIV